MSTKAPGRSNKLTGLPVLLTIAQVAEATNLCEKTIRRRVSDQTLRAVRIGPRAIRIERDSVLEILRPLGAARLIMNPRLVRGGEPPLTPRPPTTPAPQPS